MSDLTYIEKQKFEKLFGMGTGYVWSFSDRTFREFVMDSTGLDIEDKRYQYGSGSKANRLRAFWQKEENAVVGKLMKDMLDLSGVTGELEQQCRGIVARLLNNSVVTKVDGSKQDEQQPIRDFDYDVAISFAGAQRAEAKAIATFLDNASVKVFFDEFETAKLWGTNLSEYLSEVYHKKARHCLMLISAAYASSAWPNHERQSAQARALFEQGYILPVRFDQTEVPGLLPTIGYLEFDKYGAEGIARLLREKLNGSSNVEHLPPTALLWKESVVPEPGEFFEQRRRLQDTDILKKIWSKPRWRICIRPTEFKKARFQNVDQCAGFMSASQVHIVGSEPYPCVPSRAARTSGDEWVVGEKDFEGGYRGNGAEYWVLFRSAQFIDHRAFDENLRLGKRIHVLRIMDITTAALKFASRMAEHGVLQPETVVSFEMHGVDGHGLTWPQEVVGDRDNVSGNCWCPEDKFGIDRQTTPSVLRENYLEIAFEIALEIYSKFNWTDLPSSVLNDLRHRQLGVS